MDKDCLRKVYKHYENLMYVKGNNKSFTEIPRGGLPRFIKENWKITESFFTESIVTIKEILSRRMLQSLLVEDYFKSFRKMRICSYGFEELE